MGRAEEREIFLRRWASFREWDDVIELQGMAARAALSGFHFYVSALVTGFFSDCAF